MKQWMLIIAAVFVTVVLSAQPLRIDEIRKNFSSAVKDEKLCEEMISKLEKHGDRPVFQAYLGAYRAVWANHVFNPFGKLETFNKGKRLIEAAVAEERDNPEIRYVRFVIQSNAPAMLNYRAAINEDREFLSSKIASLEDPELQKLIVDALEKTKR